MTSRVPHLLLLVVLLAATGCARALEVGSEPRPTYRIAIENRLAEAMIVSYAEPRGEALLGTVPAGRTDYFIIAATAGSSVVVTARNATGTLVRGPYTLQLTAGETRTLRLE